MNITYLDGEDIGTTSTGQVLETLFWPDTEDVRAYVTHASNGDIVIIQESQVISIDGKGEEG